MASASDGDGALWSTLPDELAARIAACITEDYGPAYDEVDIAAVAARCACAGTRGFLTISDKIYNLLSPRLGTDPGVNEASTGSAMKDLLIVS